MPPTPTRCPAHEARAARRCSAALAARRLLDRRRTQVDVNNGGEFRFVAGTPAGEVIPADERAVGARRSPAPCSAAATFDSAELAGEVAVLNFWGSWCAPCRVETPQFQEVYADVRDDGVQFLGLNVKETERAVRAGLRRPLRHRRSRRCSTRAARWRWRSGTTRRTPSRPRSCWTGESRVAAVYTGEVSQDDLRRVLDLRAGGGLTMGETFAGLVTDGPLLVAAAVAALVGLISFASPCVLPLVPGYLSYVTGLVGTGARTTAPPARVAPAGGDGDRGAHRRAPAAGRMVLGRAAVRARLHRWSSSPSATAFGGLGPAAARARRRPQPRLRRRHRRWSGWRFLGWLPLLQRTKRLSARPAAGLAGAPLLGIVFGLGWTPCLGPDAVGGLLAGLLRGDRRPAARCSASPTASGSGVPFVLVALGARWAMGATSFLRRHARTVTRVGGAVLVLVGLLLVTGAWTEMMQWLRSWLAATGFGESAL